MATTESGADGTTREIQSTSFYTPVDAIGGSHMAPEPSEPNQGYESDNALS